MTQKAASRTTELGEFSLRPLRIPEDIPLVHSWVSQSYAHFWGLTGTKPDDVEKAYRAITAPERAAAFVGSLEERPTFLLETYHPADEPVSCHYEARDSDRGMHLLVAPTKKPISGFTKEVFCTVISYLFSQPEVERVVVEPDVRNEKIRALNRWAGFVEERTVALPATPTTPEKTAMLSFCTRESFRKTVLEREAER